MAHLIRNRPDHWRHILLLSGLLITVAAPAAAGGPPPPIEMLDLDLAPEDDASGDIVAGPLRKPFTDLRRVRIGVVELDAGQADALNGFACDGSPNDGIVIVCAGGAPFEAGRTLIAEVTVDAPIPLALEEGSTLDFGLVVDSDGDPANNAPASHPAAGTDLTFDVFRGENRWFLSPQRHTADGFVDTPGSGARGIVTGSTVTIVVPGSELTADAPSSRMYAITQEAGTLGVDTFPEGSGLHQPQVLGAPETAASTAPSAPAGRPAAEPAADDGGFLSSPLFWLLVAVGGMGGLGWVLWTTGVIPRPRGEDDEGPQLTFEGGPLVAHHLPSGVDGSPAALSFVAAYGERMLALLKPGTIDPPKLMPWDPIPAPEPVPTASAEKRDEASRPAPLGPMDSRVSHVDWGDEPEALMEHLDDAPPARRSRLSSEDVVRLRKFLESIDRTKEPPPSRGPGFNAEEQARLKLFMESIDQVLDETPPPATLGVREIRIDDQYERIRDYVKRIRTPGSAAMAPQGGADEPPSGSDPENTNSKLQRPGTFVLLCDLDWKIDIPDAVPDRDPASRPREQEQ